MADVDYLPIWHKGADACTRLQELAAIARKYPERFSKVLIIYREENDERNSTLDRHIWSDGVTTDQLIGMLENTKFDIIAGTRKE